MKLAGWITLFYGFIILVGGVIGHLKAASTASLIVGVIFGVLLMMCAIGMFRDKLFPAYMGILMTLILDVFFIYRYLYTFKFLPAGLMALISLFVLVVVLILVRNYFKNQRQR